MLKFCLPILLFFAQTVCQAANYDRPGSVTVSGVDITRPISASQFEKIFNRQVNTRRDAEFMECTANFELPLSATGYQARLEIFPEYNTPEDFQALEKKGTVNKARLKGKLWLTLDSSQLAHFPVRIGQLELSSDFGLADFRRNFPRSARPGAVEAEGADNVYTLLIDEDGEALPYMAHIRLHFRHGLLRKIIIHQGVAC
jgi:hypothetical protein